MQKESWEIEKLRSLHARLAQLQPKDRLKNGPKVGPIEDGHVESRPRLQPKAKLKHILTEYPAPAPPNQMAVVLRLQAHSNRIVNVLNAKLKLSFNSQSPAINTFRS